MPTFREMPRDPSDPSGEQFARALFSLETLKRLGQLVGGEAQENPLAQLATLPATFAAGGGSAPRSDRGGLLDAISRIAGRMSVGQRPMRPDLENEGAAAATRAFSRRFPGTSPEVMADLQPGERTTRTLAAHARGAMAGYMGKNAGPVPEPPDVSGARSKIQRWEALLEQKFGGGPISDEAIAASTRLPLDTVRQLRANVGYRVSVDPVHGALYRDPEAPSSRSARILPNPEPEAPKPDIDPIRDAMARTPAQKRILELWQQDAKLADIARDVGMDPRNVRRRLDQMIERGKKARAKLPEEP